MVSDFSKAVDYYRVSLGFSVVHLSPADDPFFAIVERDGVRIMLKVPDTGVKPVPNCTVHEWVLWDAFIYCDDPSWLAKDFAGRGVRPGPKVILRDDGLSGFEVSDPDGYVLFFGKPDNMG